MTDNFASQMSNLLLSVELSTEAHQVDECNENFCQVLARIEPCFTTTGVVWRYSTIKTLVRKGQVKLQITQTHECSPKAVTENNLIPL